LQDVRPDGAVIGSRGGRILLIDHDVSVLEAVEAILRDGNHMVRAAASVAEAERLFNAHEFDVVVADADVRANGGGEALSDWLNLNKPALVKCVVWMRASAMPAIVEKHPGNGVPVLQKPFKAVDLLAAVETAMGQRALGSVQPAAIQG
jgi:DNA-binding NtrC family response regulator